MNVKAISFVATTLLLAGGTAKAATYDAFLDFSIASNPAGQWSYGFGTPGGAFTPMTSTAPAFGSVISTPAWYQANSFNIPAILANETGSLLSVASLSLPAGSLALHPGTTDDTAATLRFTAPSAGVYDYNFDFERADITTGGDGVGVTVYDNSAVLLGRTVIPPALGSGGVASSGSITLASGDILSFVVDRNADFFNDFTAFTARITSRSVAGVPESGSLANLAAAFLFLLGVGRIMPSLRGGR